MTSWFWTAVLGESKVTLVRIIQFRDKFSLINLKSFYDCMHNYLAYGQSNIM